jgi:hypothetical protein
VVISIPEKIGKKSDIHGEVVFSIPEICGHVRFKGIVLQSLRANQMNFACHIQGKVQIFETRITQETEYEWIPAGAPFGRRQACWGRSYCTMHGIANER